MSRNIDDLEREIAETRSDLDDALDMLQAKLTPSALIDQALGHAQNHPKMFTSGMGQMYAHRPFTALLMTAGMNWYLSKRAEKRAREDDREWQAYAPSERHRVRELAARARNRVKSSTAKARSRVSEIAHQAGEKAHLAGEEAHHLSDTAKEKMHTLAGDARDRMHTLADGTRERLHGLKQSGTERMHDMADRTRERSHRMADKTRSKMQRGKARAESFIERQPLLAGAIALIVGTAIASAIPSTPQERKAARPLAGTAKRLKNKAKTELVHGIERGAEMATQALDNATTKIEEAMPGRVPVH